MTTVTLDTILITMKTIPLKQGKFALVDDADFEAVNAFKWYLKENRGRFYALRKIRKPDGTWGTQSLHHFLMPGVVLIDHRDGNGLNNQRHNLRAATPLQNVQWFCRKKAGATSKFRGVSWNKWAGKWQSQIKVCGKNKHLGYFASEEDAARARDAATLKYFGPDAHFNFPL